MNARIALSAMAVAISACATVEPMPAPPGALPGSTCANAGLEQFQGQPGTQELGAEMLRVSGARTLRWVRPGMAVTMDFRADRLTVHLDSAGRVEHASCG